VRIAIVGAGISGLAAAHRLQHEHEVTVFEAGPYAGGHTNTITVETERGPLAIDTGFIVFNDRNYPRFERLLAELGVASQPSDMSFGVTDERGDFEYASTSPNGLFAKRSHLADPAFLRLLADVPRFQRAARELLTSEHDPSLRQWLADEGFGEAFVERVIVPQAAAVWSSDPDQMWTFPARFLLQFFANHGMLGLRGRPRWRTVAGGSRTYVEALLRRLDARVHLDSPVEAIERRPDAVHVTPRGGEPQPFDEVVLAVHADQALQILGDEATALEREVLGAFPYQPNQAVLHTDRSLLPRRRRAWASWNYHLLDDPGGRPATVTYWMNRLQSLDTDRQYLVTLNRTEAIDPAHVIRTIDYAHPVYTAEGAKAQQRHGEVSGADRIHFCGAYWRWGFHEDGVESASWVTDRLLARPQHTAVAA
jgi:uncharacterized protein